MPKHVLALYRTRRRWTEDNAREVLAALDASGLSAGAFATREGFDAQRLYWWRRRLGVGNRDHVTVPGFVELTASADAAGHVEIALLSGRVLRVPVAIDTAVLRRLVDVLEQDRAC
jgi:transposase-like protein